MRTAALKGAIAAASVAFGLCSAGAPVHAASWDQRSTAERGVYTAAAVAANVVPGVSALVAPKCLPGYVVCKMVFAALSVVAAAESLVMSGGADAGQPRAILERGFGGDWVLTGRHVAGDHIPEPLPEAVPASAATGAGDRVPTSFP